MKKDSNFKLSTIAIFSLSASLILLLEIALGVFLYQTLKRDFEEEFLRKVGQGICKEEFRQLLNEKADSFNLCKCDNLQNQILRANNVAIRLGRSIHDHRHGFPHHHHGNQNGHGHWWGAHLNTPQPSTGQPGLPGPPGPPGIPGADGLSGTVGQPGPPGLHGQKGETGSMGPAGAPGLPGGRGEVGPPGPLGLTGLQGAPGVPGLKGEIGPMGPPGLTGVPGITGTPGLQGTPGLPGKEGLPGLTGAIGSPGEPGKMGPKGNTGTPGLIGMPGKIEKGVKGDKGEIGIMGQRGIDGGFGKPGPKGDTGERGFSGLDGLPGQSGSKGDKGDIGLTAMKGEPGEKGATGPPGFQGEPGKMGPKGNTGTPGLIGMPGKIEKGVKGDKGEIGIMGQRGIDGGFGRPGQKGDTGERGFPGLDGLPGQSGSKGDKGHIGLTSMKGEPGEKGTTGPSGFQGSKGEPGNPGLHGQPGFNGRDGQHGTKGDKGEMGAVGFPGLQGLPGKPGTIGPRGLPCSCDQVSSTNNSESITITTFGSQLYPEFVIKSFDRSLVSIGMVENFGYFDKPHSSWMVDPNPLDDGDSYKIYATSINYFKLYEFNNIESFEKNEPTKVYELDMAFDGSANAIYKGTFYYKINNKKPRIVKYHLKTEKTHSVNIDELLSQELKPLYMSKFNYFDFSVDENGLWVIFSSPQTENTAVAKIDEDTLLVEKIWEINIKNRKYIDMFIASGVLYTIEYTPNGEVKIDVAINLLTNNVTRLNLDGIVQTGGITMATYNHRLKKILIVDDHNRIGYPVTWNDEEPFVPAE